MPSVAERLEQVQLKIKRAKEHIADLQREVVRFLDTKPYKIASKHDPQSRKLIIYVSSVESTPKCLPLIAGDAIQNLMSALDHLAYQLVCSDTGDAPPNPNWIYFPIQDDRAKYEAKKGGKIEGAAQATIDAIDILEPYNGGKGPNLWVLYRLNNIEKHRILLTVGSHAGSVNLAQDTARRLPKGGIWDGARDWLAKTPMFFKLADRGFPLKAGFELYIGAVDEEPDPNQQFRFDVAMAEPGILESESLLETLHQLTTLVEGIVTALTPRLRDTP